MEKMWNQNLILAKYHYSVCERLFENFKDYETKRFLSATIKEASISLMHFINSLLIYHKSKDKINLRKRPLDNFKKIANRYYSQGLIDSLIILIRVEKDQKASPIEILRGNKILYLIGGEYKTLTYGRLKELLGSLNKVIKTFPKD